MVIQPLTWEACCSVPQPFHEPHTCFARKPGKVGQSQQRPSSSCARQEHSAIVPYPLSHCIPLCRERAGRPLYRVLCLHAGPASGGQSVPPVLYLTLIQISLKLLLVQMKDFILRNPKAKLVMPNSVHKQIQQ